MILVDAQLPPSLAPWITATFSVDAKALRDIGLRDAEDEAIYQAAHAMNAVVMTKDSDFVSLQDRLGPPPQIIWITCGNTSNANLKLILIRSLPHALQMLAGGEALVEISG